MRIHAEAGGGVAGGPGGDRAGDSPGDRASDRPRNAADDSAGVPAGGHGTAAVDGTAVDTASGTVARVRTSRRAGRDKGDVLTAAVRVIAQRGADSTRFTDVAQASGVPVSTLQYYFGSREDLLVAAFRHASETELAALRTDLAALDDPWEKLVRVVDQALGDYAAGQGGHLWIEAWRFGTRDAEMRADVLRDYAAWREVVAGAVRDGVEGGRFRASVDPRRVAVLLVSLLDGLGMPLALGDPGLSVAAAREACLDALAAAVGYEEG